MKEITCDFCKGKNNKDFKYKLFEYKFPVYGALQIHFISMDICAKCFAGIFNKPKLQNKLRNIKEEITTPHFSEEAKQVKD